MNLVDIVILVAIAVPVFQGLRKGLIGSLLSLVGIILGIFLAGQFYDTVGSWLGFIDNPDIANVAGFIIILVATMVVAEIIARVLRTIISIVLLGWVDKLGGAVFGGLLGAIAVSALLATWVHFFETDAIVNSGIASLLLDNFPIILGLLPAEFDTIRDFFS
jgi:membrane protein required for colicin V production